MAKKTLLRYVGLRTEAVDRNPKPPEQVLDEWAGLRMEAVDRNALILSASSLPVRRSPVSSWIEIT